MKTRLGLLAAFVFLFSISGCKKAAVDIVNGNCDDKSEAYLKAVTGFSASPTKKNCEVLVGSLQNLVNKCSILTVSQTKEYKDALASIKCSDYN
jgi:hypothetical protein